jgi:Fe-S-cluster containining protein
MWHGPVYDCQQCGACCAKPAGFPETAYVFLEREESKRLKRIGLSVVQTTSGPYLGVRAYVGDAVQSICVAFRGAIGAACRCSIYESRPRNCRRFTVGSALCLAARTEAGLSTP